MKKTILMICANIVVATSLSAQAPTIRTSTISGPGVIRQLEQNALWALIGGVVLIGTLCIISVAHECAQLGKPLSKNKRSFGLWPILMFGLSVLGSSCRVALQPGMTAYPKRMAAENFACSMNYHDYNQNTQGYNPFNGYVNFYGPAFCKRCGQRIQRNR